MVVQYSTVRARVRVSLCVGTGRIQYCLGSCVRVSMCVSAGSGDGLSAGDNPRGGAPQARPPLAQGEHLLCQDPVPGTPAGCPTACSNYLPAWTLYSLYQVHLQAARCLVAASTCLVPSLFIPETLSGCPTSCLASSSDCNVPSPTLGLCPLSLLAALFRCSAVSPFAVQPIHQACNVPSPSLWAYLRGTYLLPPRGLPMLQQQSWYLRKSLPRTPPTLPPLAPLDDDWAVLLALPPASLPLAVSAEFGGYYQSAPSVESLMQANFWFRHVDFFKWASKPAAGMPLVTLRDAPNQRA